MYAAIRIRRRYSTIGDPAHRRQVGGAIPVTDLGPDNHNNNNIIILPLQRYLLNTVCPPNSAQSLVLDRVI